MKYIRLASGESATVDDVDFAHLSQWSWHLGGFQRRYARRNTFYSGSFFMHREVAARMGLCIKGAYIDHKDGNCLNNLRSNIRLATPSQNQANRGMSRNNSSGYKGVRKQKSGRWQAIISVKHRSIHLGCFDSPEEAAAAYDAASKRYNGDFARTNGSKQTVADPRGTNYLNTSGFRGVSRYGNKWRAVIGSAGRTVHIGVFDNILDAALAYNKAAKKYLGPKAYQNPIPEELR